MSIRTVVSNVKGICFSFWKPDNIISDSDSSLDDLPEEEKRKLSAELMKSLYDSSKKVDDAALKCGQPSKDKLKKFREEAKRFSQENEEVKDKNNEKDNKPKDKEPER